MTEPHRESMQLPAGPPAGWYPDPQLSDGLRYWDGKAWTQDRYSGLGLPRQAASSPTQAVAEQGLAAGSAGAKTVDHTFVWTLAFAPLIFAVLPLAFPGISADAAFSIAVLVNSILAITDQVRLDRAGVHVHAAWALFLVPGYLIVRTMRAKSTPAIPVVWFVALLGSFVLDNAVAANGPVTMDGPRVERQLVNQIRSQYGETTQIDCPTSPSVKVGDSFDCSVDASDGTYHVYVTVTDADGRYQWTLTQ